MKFKIIFLFIFLILIAGCIEKEKVSENKTHDIRNITENIFENNITIIGETKYIGDGIAIPFISLDKYSIDGNNKPYAIGVTFSEDALSNLPDEETEYILKLPDIKQEPIFDHIGINWNIRGHVPSGIYDKPHFDFHFYMITVEEREMISGEKMFANVPREYMPADYIQTASGVPKMGVHWADPFSEEFKGKFDKTIIYGFFNGSMVFIEPMITIEYFKSFKEDFVQNIKLPEKYPKKGFYPTKYGIRKKDKNIIVTIEDMKYFE